MKPIQRVEILVKRYNMSVREFEREVDVSNNSIGAATRRKTSLKDDTLIKILNRFEEISPAWLLMGEGEMLRKDNASDSLTDEAIRKINEMHDLLHKQELERSVEKAKQALENYKKESNR